MKGLGVALVTVALIGCGDGPLEIAGADYTTQLPVANGVDPQIAPNLLPNGAPNHGIYLYWLFDSDSLAESSDASGHARSGTLANRPSLSDPAPALRRNNVRGLFFDGTGQSVSYLADTPFTEFSVGMWVKPAPPNPSRLFTLQSEAVDQVAFEIGAGGRFEVRVLPGADPLCSPPGCAAGLTQVVADTWYHAAVTFAADGEARLFVNGAEEARVHAPGLPSVAQRCLLGARHDSSPSFRGGLDETIVYDWALDVGAVAALARRLTPLPNN